MCALEGRGSPCRTGRWLLVIVISAWITGAGRPSTPEESSLWKRLIAEAPPGWKQYREHWVTIEGSCQGERRELRNGKWETVSLSTHWKTYDHNMLRQVETSQSGSWSGKIIGENSQYIFVLFRDGATKPWVIEEVTKKGKMSSEFWEGLKRDAPGLMLFKPGPLGLPELIQSKNFKVADVSTEPGNSEELVRLTFTYSPDDGKADRLRGGVVVLDPSRDWVIRRGEIDFDPDVPKKGKYIVEYDYQDGLDHCPIMTKSRIKGTIWENDRVVYGNDTTVSGDVQERKFVPESEFTLSAFGLPEPNWARPKQTAWYLWLGLAGILCMILGVAFAWIKKRRARVTR
jgi:hypothetical protein